MTDRRPADADQSHAPEPSWRGAERALARRAWPPRARASIAATARRARWAPRVATARTEPAPRGAPVLAFARAGRWTTVDARARLALTVVVRSRPLDRAARALPPRPTVGAAARPSPRVEPAARHAAATAERVVRRSARVERATERGAPTRPGASATAADPAEVARRAAPPAADTVPRVVRRTTPRPEPARPDDGWGTPIARPSPAAAPALPPAELARVAEHVLQTIDRRVQAHRERRGRV